MQPKGFTKKDHPRPLHILVTVFLSYILAVLVSLVMDAPNSFKLIAGQLVFVLPAMVLVRSQGFDFQKAFRLVPVSREIAYASIVIGVSAPILFDELDRLIGTVIKMPKEQEDLLAGLLVAQDWVDWVLLGVGVIFIAALSEEMLFRGLLQQALERRAEAQQAVMFSALIFAIIHPYPWFIQILLIGYLLGYLSWRSKSILPGAIIHACNNCFALFMMNFGGDGEAWYDLYDWHGHVHPTAIACAACVAFYGFRWLRRLLLNIAQDDDNEYV